MPSDHTFEEVLAAAQSGEECAWGLIVTDLAGSLIGYFRSRGAADPEDLAGRVFLDLAQRLESFEGGRDAFRSWTFVIAHRRLVDERRLRARRPEQPRDPRGFEEAALTSSAESEAMAALDDAAVRRMLRTLTPAQGDVIALRIVVGLSVEETARAVGRKPGAVKALQRRGLESLRRQIESETVSK